MHFLGAPTRLLSPAHVDARDSARPARTAPVPSPWQPRDVLLTLECLPSLPLSVALSLSPPLARISRRRHVTANQSDTDRKSVV